MKEKMKKDPFLNLKTSEAIGLQIALVKEECGLQKEGAAIKARIYSTEMRFKNIENKIGIKDKTKEIPSLRADQERLKIIEQKLGIRLS